MTLPNNLLENAGNLRDAVLLIVSVIYFIGYITWASYSYFRRLGTVRALDAQYFVIGIPVVLLMALVISVMSSLGLWLDSWNSFLQGLGSQVRLTIGVGLAGLVLLLAYFLLKSKSIYSYRPYILIIAMLTTWLFIPDSGGLLRVASHITFILVTLATFAFITTLYVTIIYERIPHTLGGGKTRTACLDLVRKALSPSLLKELTANRVGRNQSIVQSRDVTVVSISDNWVLVRVGQIKDITAPVIEIPRSAIASIIWRKD
jgi:hypothetical protein